MPDELEEVRRLVDMYGAIGLLSTGARIINVSDEVYNVSGSTHDPKHVPDFRGAAWKKLLVEMTGLGDAECYVTNELPEGKSSHPDFSVGGHMTKQRSGEVRTGDITYLMPLCHWHNSPGRNGLPYEHDETLMLELKGFMQGDTPAAFAMRLPPDAPFSLLYFNRGAGMWDSKKLDGEEAARLAAQPSTEMDPTTSSRMFVVFEQKDGRYFPVMQRL
jgi:hypothetical protein